MTVSAADPQVQEALRIIDKVMLSQGLPRATRPLAAEDKARGIIANYGRCSVWLATNTLNVGFVEFGPRRSGAFVRETSRVLKDGLSERYGPDKVTMRIE